MEGPPVIAGRVLIQVPSIQGWHQVQRLAEPVATGGADLLAEMVRHPLDVLHQGCWLTEDEMVNLLQGVPFHPLPWQAAGHGIGIIDVAVPKRDRLAETACETKILGNV